MVELKYSGLHEIEQVSKVLVILTAETVHRFLGVGLKPVASDLEYVMMHLKSVRIVIWVRWWWLDVKKCRA